jgi:dTDP-4-dehydrorhamnose reductase
MNVAITGVSGLLGAHVAAALSNQHRVVGFDRHPWWGTRPVILHEGDLADDYARAAFLEDARPDLLVHCAAMANVDLCEERPAQAYHVNGTLTGLLVRAVPRNCTVVYVTTDGIFRGDEPMQRESDLPCPRTVYGRSKLHGEWETQLATERHLVLRTNFYGWSSGVKQTAAEWLYYSLASNKEITLFDDFWFTPLYVVDFVQRLLALVARGSRGTFHVVGSERVSKYEFGRYLSEASGIPMTAVRRGSIADAALKAPRPHDMSLNADKVVAALGSAIPDCASGVRRFLADRRRTLEERVAGVTLS